MAVCSAIGMEMIMPLLSGSHKQPFTSFLLGVCDHAGGFQRNHFYIEEHICVYLSGIYVHSVLSYSVLSLIRSV